jgi:DNA (cytosine-5)-methyltransferase 1
MSDAMKPLLLDTFCKAGGCSRGYQMAGFRVVGVDIEPQPRYIGDAFEQGDALDVLQRLIDGGAVCGYRLENFAAIHASPPCQGYSNVSGRSRKTGKREYPKLVPNTRKLLRATGLPFVIENVVGAPLYDPVMLCGSAFGLNVRRHRLFESNVLLFSPGCQHYWQRPRFRTLDSRRKGKLACVIGVHGHLNYSGERQLREDAMGIDWMEVDELSQAIPPVFTHFIGRQLMQHISEGGIPCQPR